jgi:hypothetical protein
MKSAYPKRLRFDPDTQICNWPVDFWWQAQSCSDHCNWEQVLAIQSRWRISSCLLLSSAFSHQIKKTVDHLLSVNVTEEGIDDAIENFRQKRLLTAEEEAKDVSI